MLEQYYVSVKLLENRINELETSIFCALCDKKQRLSLLRAELDDLYDIIAYLEGKSPSIFRDFSNTESRNYLRHFPNKYCSKTL